MDYNYTALVLGIPLIIIILLGNILVCLSVLTEQSLKTPTNYFIISLSVADLLLATLVLPLYVYSEFLGGIWTLSTLTCDALMSMDVMLCTASILNLCAISVDRYIAVAVPLTYSRNRFSARQLLLITATWVLSMVVASPVIFGLNQVPGRDPAVCKLEDDRFVVYSSVCSFFVPCPVMLFLYYWMFRGLRRWSARSRSQTDTARHQAFSLHFGAALHQANTPQQPNKAFGAASELSPTAPPRTNTRTASHAEQNLDGVAVVAESDPVTAQMNSVSDKQPAEGGRMRRGNSSNSSARKQRRSSSKTSRVSRKERKAMKVLPVVVGAFLVCWTPFFVVHVTKVLCKSCDIGPTLISVVTWLGYVNSAVNPIIYTAFNAEFRTVFQKMMCCHT
ncbi:D(4) dopamine receptor-like [Oryzias latipes]|uniref:G-protein coupled receptors family 1 profile domain-containing protein n=1 Tax=Oryzias latipes TaxID=8090 RepID=H2N0P7_ORYLA|nr:D(4) dopamine receptor-like [Oryzias latipes]